jgi:membrane protein involved in colicin uptake
MGRPPLFGVRLTDAERSKRYRDSRRQELKQLRAAVGHNKVTPPKKLRAAADNKVTPQKEGIAVPAVTDLSFIKDMAADDAQRKAKIAAEAEANAKANAERDASLKNTLDSLRVAAKDNEAKVEAASDAVFAELAAEGIEVDMLKSVARHLKR